MANIRAALKKKLAPELEQAISIYHFRGGIDWPRLSPVHRMMMNVMLSMVRKKPEDQRSGEDRAMLETAGQVVDFCDRQTIAPLVEQARADAAAIDK
ncbi:hypothetical protein SDC9_153591 [bioreactor metagenome]|uniref:Uncharacterized protein n=1 Tax=bioreactor metagenome TaxID=1076179 RepID=A0A645EWD8_9ZZZZ